MCSQQLFLWCATILSIQASRSCTSLMEVSAQMAWGGDSSSCKWIQVKDRTSPAPDFTTSSTDCPNPKGLAEREAHWHGECAPVLFFCTVVPFSVPSIRFSWYCRSVLVPSFQFWGSREHPPKPPLRKPPFCEPPTLKWSRFTCHVFTCYVRPWPLPHHPAKTGKGPLQLLQC